MLTARKIKLFSADNQRVKTLLLELFPERERLSMALLRFRSLSSMVDYFGYYLDTMMRQTNSADLPM